MKAKGNTTNPLSIAVLLTPILLLIAVTIVLTSLRTPENAVFAPAGASIYQGTTTSFLGMALITLGCGVFLFSAFKHFTRRKTRKRSRGVPVLFDRLGPEAIARLQHKISQVSNMPSVPGHSHMMNSNTHDLFGDICDSVDDTEDEPAEANPWQKVSSEISADPRQDW